MANWQVWKGQRWGSGCTVLNLLQFQWVMISFRSVPFKTVQKRALTMHCTETRNYIEYSSVYVHSVLRA
jgi:hypothetical protein